MSITRRTPDAHQTLHTAEHRLRLGVNIDHIATLRQARGSRYPDPVYAAAVAEQAGADGITVHLREDRRHIQERDVRLLKQTLQTPMNLEMALTDAMLDFAEEITPENICVVPEKRAELTTEGGLDVCSQEALIRQLCARFAGRSLVSLFIDPEIQQIEAAHRTGAPVVEIHTGAYAEAKNETQRAHELERIKHAVTFAQSCGLRVNAGHGLHYHNVEDIAAIPGLYELNIGHSIITHALFVGLAEAVRTMKRLMTRRVHA